jgi:hypothetical protein
MPHILVTAETIDGQGRTVMFTERVTIDDFDSRHFQHQLVERLSWAVDDAQAIEVDTAHAARVADSAAAADRTERRQASSVVQRRSARVVTTAS